MFTIRCEKEILSANWNSYDTADLTTCHEKEYPGFG
jgi:hypothetical protein